MLRNPQKQAATWCVLVFGFSLLYAEMHLHMLKQPDLIQQCWEREGKQPISPPMVMSSGR